MWLWSDFRAELWFHALSSLRAYIDTSQNQELKFILALLYLHLTSYEEPQRLD